MQSVENFLHDCFRDRTELLRKACLGWESHTLRFFGPLYQPYNPEKAVADSEAERIISINSADGSAEAITTGWAGGRWRFRYYLSAADERWLINRMEMECGICHGSGKRKDSECRLCKGVGWTLLVRDSIPDQTLQGMLGSALFAC